MRKALILPAAALALAALSACGNQAGNEAAEANESMAGDSNTMGDAVADVNAAESAAFTDAENAYAVTGNDLGNEIVD
jgi:protein involved in sex pheromone biosynthesis